MIFVVFAALTAVVNYELTITLYSSDAPLIFVALNVLTATIPFIVYALLSFTVAFVAAKASEPTKDAQSELKDEAEETTP